MKTIRLTGRVDDQHRLVADVPSTVAPGPVEVDLLLPQGNETVEDDSSWERGIALEWSSELSDPREDIYTDADGEPADDAR